MQCHLDTDHGRQLNMCIVFRHSRRHSPDADSRQYEEERLLTHVYSLDPHKTEPRLAHYTVEEEITAQIDDMVKEYVAECLKAHIPQDLQDEVAMSKKELEELNLRLHNSCAFLCSTIVTPR
jgi:hypothetical protein